MLASREESYLDVSPDVTPGDLVDMIAAQRRLISELRNSHPPRPDELAVHERTLQYLTDELHRQSPPGHDDSGAAIRAAGGLADIFHFDVPPSHRAGTGSRAITAAKRVVIGGMKPFHVELLRPQREFNVQLVVMLEEVLARRGAATPADADRRLRGTLEPLLDPAGWRVSPSHRSGVVGNAVGLAKRSYLKAVGPLLRKVLEVQRQWNEAALEAAISYVTWDKVARSGAEQKIAELTALAAPLAREDISKAVKASLPLWSEVFRRQTAFNQQMVQVFASLFKIPAAPVDYLTWCGQVEPAQIKEAAAATFKTTPLFSIITPTYQSPEPLLRSCIDSVLRQSYPNWELCIADDGSTEPHVLALLDEYTRKDPRIRVTRLPSNGGIVKATNAALAMAKGEFVAFLDHDDELAPHALAENARRLNEEPTLDVLYSDEDKLDDAGRRAFPFFKPDWSPDLLRSGNYLSHLLVARRSLVEQVGGAREGMDFVQDYDLMFRLIERTDRIGHIPRVLYHWRVGAASTSADVRNKPAAAGKGRRALVDHLQRCGEEATVEEPIPTTYWVRYPVRGHPLVSIIVPFKDKPELLDQLLRSLLPITRYTNYEILLISNNSSRPETFALLDAQTDPRIRKLTWNHPFNYSAICNYGASEAKGELLLFLNNDIEIVDPGWMEELIGQAQRPEVGAVGPKLLFPDGTLQHAGVVLGLNGFAGHTFAQMPDVQEQWTPFGHHNWTRNYLAVTGACVMMRRRVFEQLGGYDERFLICGSDVELCLRMIEGGLRVIYTPWTKLIHHESASRRTLAIPENDFWRSFAAYRRYLERGDPYYNPNLSLSVANGSLRTDPRDGETIAVQHLTTELASSRTPPITRARVEFQRFVMEKVATLDFTPSRKPLVQGFAPGAKRTGSKLERITWLIPYFLHPFGGVHTILRFGHLLQQRHGVKSQFVIYDNPPANVRLMDAKVAALFPELAGTLHVLPSLPDAARLPPSDVAVATLWSSAYPLIEHTPATLKAYFIQDYEPQFYAAGSLSAMAEQTYLMGLYGIVNTPGLHEYVTSHYPMTGCWFEPSVEHELFHDRRPARSGPTRIFFYARPSTDRNGFELGISALRGLKKAMGAQVEIVTAGESWNAEDYGAGGVVNNLGVLPYEKTADLYRTCDVGLCFMFTKHPSYLPLEMMASGVTVVTNENPANRWLLEHGVNCLLAKPTYSSVLEQLQRAVSDGELRARVGGAAAERLRRTTWEAQADKVFEALQQHLASPGESVENVAPGLPLRAQEREKQRV